MILKSSRPFSLDLSVPLWIVDPELFVLWGMPYFFSRFVLFPMNCLRYKMGFNDWLQIIYIFCHPVHNTIWHLQNDCGWPGVLNYYYWLGFVLIRFQAPWNFWVRAIGDGHLVSGKLAKIEQIALSYGSWYIRDSPGQAAIIFPASWQREERNQNFLWKINAFSQANGVFLMIIV